MTRADSGKYIVTAKNDSGTDTVEVEVDVVSKPSKPKGPLKVSLLFLKKKYCKRIINPKTNKL